MFSLRLYASILLITPITVLAQSWDTISKVTKGSSDGFQTLAEVRHIDGSKTVAFVVRAEDPKKRNCDLAYNFVKYSETGDSYYEPVIYADGQALRAGMWCSGAGNNKYLGFYGKSDEAKRHLTNLFQKKTDPVIIKFGSIRLSYPTDGFNAVWDSLSDDVL